MSEWIGVKKRLPDEELKKFRDLNGLENGIGHINVLGSTGKHTLKNTVEYDGKNFWYEGRWMNSEITHWMPLPEPPEDEAMECDSCRYQNDCLLAQSDLVKKCKCYEPKKIKTNADRIRSMSDEELAKMFNDGVEFCHDRLCLEVLVEMASTTSRGGLAMAAVVAGVIEYGKEKTK